MTEAKTKRKLQKERTKELLLKTVYEVFSDRGIVNTRMSDIAHAAGVSHGSVFVHFQSQEALIEEVVATYCHKIAVNTHNLAASSGSFRELLKAHLQGIMEFEKFYTRLILENRLLPSGARDSWISVQSAVSYHFSKVHDKEFGLNRDSGIPSYMLFNMWIGLVHYYLENGDLFAPEGNVISRYQELLTDSFLNLINGGGMKNE